MNKVYQPEVIEKSENMFNDLIESGFFVDFEIDDYDFSKTILLEKVNEKYIKNLTSDDEELDIFFTEEEINLMLSEIVAGSILHSLKEKGFVNSYEDDETEEIFFLTKKGKDYAEKNLKK